MEYFNKTKSTMRIIFISASILFGTIFNSFSNELSTDDLKNIVKNSVNYYKTLKPTLTIPDYNLIVVSTGDWTNVSSNTQWNFEAGYINGDDIYITEPTSPEQKEIFPNIETVIKYTIAKELVQKVCNNNVPDWFLFGYSAFEARLPRQYESIQNFYTSNNSFPGLHFLNAFNPENNIEQRNLAFTLAEYCILIHGDRRLPWFFNRNGDIEPFTPESVEDTWHLFLEKHYLESDDQIKLMEFNDDFAIYCSPKDKDDAKEYLNEFSSYLTFLENGFQVEMTRRADILINPDKCTQLLIEGWNCDSNNGGGGHGNGMAGCAFISDKHAWYRDYKGLRHHEFTHVYQFWLKSNFMPAWLSEGFATRLPGKDELDPFTEWKTDMNNKWNSVLQSLNRYPTMDELGDYGFVRNNGVDYYILGALMVDYILKKSGYDALRQIVQSNGQDFTSMDYATKEDFLTDFYFYFDCKIMDKNVVELKFPLSENTITSDTCNIQWTPLSSSEKLNLYVSYDEQQSWNKLTSLTNATNFMWAIPKNENGKFFLKFEAYNNLNVSSVFGTFIYTTLSNIQNQTSLKNIIIFPNPTDGEINMEGFDLSKEYSLQLYDSNGRNIYNQQITTSKTNLNIKGYSTGLYNLVLIQGKKWMNYKIIKK